MDLLIAPPNLVKKELKLSLSDLFTLGYILGMGVEQNTIDKNNMDGEALVSLNLIALTTRKNIRFVKGSIQRLITAKVIKPLYKDYEGNIMYSVAPSSVYLGGE